jgi:ATP-dependent DNA helicase DinG
VTDSSDITPDRDEAVGPEELAVARALGANLSGVDLLRAHVQATGGQTRPQQESMVDAVTEAVLAAKPALVQAGTGTGKSLGYLFPLAAIGARAVVATATNQLSEQLIRHDLPRVAETLEASGGQLTFAQLKGRNQYVCRARVNELETLNNQAASHVDAGHGDRLFELDPELDPKAAARGAAKADAAQVGDVLEWAKTTPTGDRADGPSVPDRVWLQVSTSSADCPGAQACPFGATCFTEAARAKAKEANIVVTNHALLAQDIKSAASAGKLGLSTPATANGMFGPRHAVIVDEAHDLPGALTSALSSDLDPRALGKWISKAATYLIDDDVDTNGHPLTVIGFRSDLETLERVLESAPEGAMETMPRELVTALDALTTRLLRVSSLLQKAAADARETDKPKRATAIDVLRTQCEEHSTTIVEARTISPGRVRWVEQRREDAPPVLRTAPLEVGDDLRIGLGGKTLIATSATLTVADDFTPLARTLGVDGTATTLDVGTPFDYPRQGMLYIPRAPFPEPVGRDRTAHTEAVLDEVLALVTAAGGRTLALFTTTAAARRTADHLRTHLPHLNVHATGDAAADVLVREFAAEETSVLCATMGLWQGVSVEGPGCSLVIIDKVAFAPMDDVLTAARRTHADSQGRDGFREVVVASAATSLAQGAGRLIRTAADRGVVAILDPRIHTKGYGRTLIGSLPPFRLYTDRDVVTGALERLTGGTTDETRAAKPTPLSYARPTSTFTGSAGRRKTPPRASATRSHASRNRRSA